MITSGKLINSTNLNNAFMSLTADNDNTTLPYVGGVKKFTSPPYFSGSLNISTDDTFTTSATLTAETGADTKLLFTAHTGAYIDLKTRSTTNGLVVRNSADSTFTQIGVANSKGFIGYGVALGGNGISFDTSGNTNISGTLTSTIVFTTSNGLGTNLKVGDDAWIGDINIANTLQIKGGQDGTKGYIKFGNGGTIGSSGTDIQITGGLDVASISAADGTSAISITNATGVVSFNNRDITGINAMHIGDPGPNEGLMWDAGNLWRIYESPNDLTTNGAGNLQIVQNATRRATFNTSGQLEIPVATGTAPFVITSATKVANLNVEMVDSLHSTDLLMSNTASEQVISGSNYKVQSTTTAERFEIEYNETNGSLDFCYYNS